LIAEVYVQYTYAWLLRVWLSSHFESKKVEEYY